MKAITHTLAGSGLALFGLMAGAQDVPSKEIALDIKPQPMVDALNGWAQQTGFQIIVPDECAANKIDAPRVRGRLTAQAALSRLLAGTSLTYEFVNERTVAVHEQVPVSRPGLRSAASEQVNRRFLRVAMARAEEAGRASDGGVTESETRMMTAANVREAENGKPRRGVLEEIIVTAQKREERLQDVPISISVLSGVELDKSNIADLREAFTRIPGVVADRFFGDGDQISIRGVSTGVAAFSGSSTVAYYLDAAPFGFVRSALAPELGHYDLDRVEVLRGPQGTLYGASALSGVIRVLTQDPSFEGFDLKARVGASHTAEFSSGMNYRADAAVNIPIVEDKLAARATVSYQDWSGWIDKPLVGKKDVNDAQLSTMRLKIRAQPTDQLSMLAAVWLDRGDQGGLPLGRRDHTRRVTVDEPLERGYDSYSFKIGYDFPAFNLTSATSYLDYETRNTNAFGTIFRDNIFTARVFSQEINVASTHEGPWRWSVGGLYRDAEEISFMRHKNVDVNGPLLWNPIDNDSISESFAWFGEVTYAFLEDRLELTAGMRYFEDTQTHIVRSDLTLATIPATPFEFEDEFDKWTPRVILNWRPSDQLTLYASYAQGYRSGMGQYIAGINIAALAGVEVVPADPDTLTNYEIGAKGDLFGGFVTFDTAVYFADWKDSQQTIYVIAPNNQNWPAVVNSESFTGIGVDAALTVRPVEGLELGGTLSWNDLKAQADVSSGLGVLIPKGARPAVSAEVTAGGSASYAFPLFGGAGFTGRLAGSINYTSPQTYYAVDGSTTIAREGDSIVMGGSSFTIDAPGHWSLTFYVDNITDENGNPSAQLNDAGFLTEEGYELRLRPRTIGLQFDFRL